MSLPFIDLSTGLTPEQLGLLEHAGFDPQYLAGHPVAFTRAGRSKILHHATCGRIDGKSNLTEVRINAAQVAGWTLHADCTMNMFPATDGHYRLHAAVQIAAVESTLGRMRADTFAPAKHDRLRRLAAAAFAAECVTLDKNPGRQRRILDELNRLNQVWAKLPAAARIRPFVASALHPPAFGTDVPGPEVLGLPEHLATIVARSGWQTWTAALAGEAGYDTARDATLRHLETFAVATFGPHVPGTDLTGAAALITVWEEHLEQVCAHEAARPEVLVAVGARPCGPAATIVAAFPSWPNSVLGTSVVCCPAAVSDWLFTCTRPGHTELGATTDVCWVAAAEDADTAEVLEVFAGLWQPGADGPLADATAALEVARAI